MGVEKALGDADGGSCIGRLQETSKAAGGDVDDQIMLNNLTCTPPNVEELMEALNDDLNSAPGEELGIIAIDKLFNEDDMMNMSMEEQQLQEVDATKEKEARSKELIAVYKERQRKMERRLDVLRRKLHKLQARKMGEHVGGEVAGVYEYVQRSLKRLKDTANQSGETSQQADDGDKKEPMSYGAAKTLLRKLEMAVACQASSLSRHKHLPKYFGSGSTADVGGAAAAAAAVASNRVTVVAGGGVAANSVPLWPVQHKQELQRVSGLLLAQVAVVQQEVDSEATESSSGGESCDEMQTYNNPHQQYLSM